MTTQTSTSSSNTAGSFIGSVVFWCGVGAILKLMGVVGYTWPEVGIFGLVVATGLSLAFWAVVLVVGLAFGASMGGAAVIDTLSRRKSRKQWEQRKQNMRTRRVA